MLKKQELKQELTKLCKPLTKGKAYYRPFICRGNSDNIKAFLVGLNPATPITEDEMSLDEYVNLISDYERFLCYYNEKRIKDGKPKLSKTRTAIISFVDWLNSRTDVSIAETNIIPYPTKNAKQLNREDESIHKRGKEIFYELLMCYKPSLLILHGKSTIDLTLNYLREKGFEVKDNDSINKLRDMQYFNVSEWPKFIYSDGNTCSIIAYRHFIYYGPNGKKTNQFLNAVEDLLRTQGLLSKK